MSNDDRRVEWPMDLKPPFRWDVRRREQLGALLDGWTPNLKLGFAGELVGVCARVIAFCGDGDLVFVGRSPDPLFDFLSGAFAGTSWEERLRPLPVSLRDISVSRTDLRMRQTFCGYLESLELAPRQISQCRRSTTLVDMVASGGTFGDLVRFWREWANELGVPWVELQRKLRLIGLVVREKTSPKTWRWQQHAEWAHLLPTRSIRNVSASPYFIGELASGSKASRSFPPYVWHDLRMAEPPRDPEHLQGLRVAVYLYETGRSGIWREWLADELMKTPGVRASWLRSLAHELRANPGSGSGFTPSPDNRRPYVRYMEEQARASERARELAALNQAYQARRAARSAQPPNE